MKKNLTKKSLKRYSRQIILKNVGIIGQKKILNSKVLIVGVGGLGCPVADLLTRSGVGTIGVLDFDKVDLSNLHRQNLYSSNDIGQYKVQVIKKKLSLINNDVKVKIYKVKANKKNLEKIINKYDIIVDGSDNFKTKFLLNYYSLKLRKKLISGAISKLDGHIFTFDFKTKKTPCLKCFYQTEPSDEY
jgi:Dinucleotide-utilizing enzymes involved in molybdopterin and thiamine biosynthesis family 2